MGMGGWIAVAAAVAVGTWLYRRSRRLGARTVASAVAALLTDVGASVLRLTSSNGVDQRPVVPSSRDEASDFDLHLARIAPDYHLFHPDPEIAEEARVHYPLHLELSERD